MKIIKRSGTEVTFDIAKIMAAVSKANKEVVHSERLSDEQIKKISVNVEEICQEMNRSLSVEEIQDLVENQIMNLRAFAVPVISCRKGGRQMLFILTGRWTVL